MRLVQVAYMSQAEPSLGLRELVPLVQRCYEKNRSLNITGVMYYDKGHIIQCLEGPDTAVIPLYARIMQDTRHRELHTVVFKPIRERMFPDWCMGLISGLKTPINVSQVRDLEGFHAGEWNDATWSEILNSFRASVIGPAALRADDEPHYDTHAA